MNKYTLMFAAAMLSALPPLSDVGAQTKSRINSPGGRRKSPPSPNRWRLKLRPELCTALWNVLRRLRPCRLH